jgi:hypothetical protein
MTFTAFQYVTNNMPPATSDYWDKPTEELMQEWRYFNESSRELRQNLWPACIRAYMCRRELPRANAMEFLDGSDLGETDIWDGINFLTDSIMNAQFPRDQSYLELIPYEDEEQASLNDVRDLMMSLFRKSNIRGQYGNHVKQTLLLGTSAIRWNWQKIFAMRRYGIAETHRRLLEAGGQDHINPDTFHQDYKKFRFPTPVFNGPLVQTIDMYDFWLDPAASLVGGTNYPIIVRFYLTVQDLKDALDEDGKPKYDNLDGIEPKTLEQIYNKDPQRTMIVRELGINPLAADNQAVKLVPIYMFHKMVRTFDSHPNDRYTDVFFYVAECDDKLGYRMIRIEENPNNSGSRGIFVDTYVDYLSGGYGIGAVEKSLNAWSYKCVISALGLNAQVASVFPAYSVIGGVMQDDQELGLTPGSLTIIKNMPGIGLNYVQPLPVPINAIEVGQKIEQWYAQKILGQMQASGAMVAQDPVKSIKSSKTATQINTETTSGSIIRDSYLEKMTICSIEPLMQDIYDAARQNLDDPIIHFEKASQNSSKMGQVTPQDIDKDRKVLLTGYHGLVNKAQEIQMMKDALEVMVQGNALEVAPQLAPVMQETLFKLLGRIGIRNLEQYEQDPISMMLQNPFLMNKVLQNPQDAQAILQLAAQVQQMQMQQQQAMAQGQAPPQPPGPAPSQGGSAPKPPQPQKPPGYQPNGSMQSPKTNPLVPKPPESWAVPPGEDQG